MYEFEKHQRLTEFIHEMASTGKAPQEWKSFIETLNQALRIHDVSGRSEQFICPCCGSNKTYKTDAIHCNRCAVTTEI